MNSQRNIKNSSLRFILRNTAIQLITGWLECAKSKYDIPGIKIISYDELEVENDFVEHLLKAIDSLINDKSREKKSTPGWSFRYICGYVQGALNVKWSNQYLIKPSNEFADMMKLKTILELLKIDGETSRKIEIIYDYFLTHGNEVANEEKVLANNIISLVQRGKLQNTNRERYKKEFDEYFGNLFMTNYMSLLQSYDFMCCPDLTKHLNEREIISIVGKEHFA